MCSKLTNQIPIPRAKFLSTSEQYVQFSFFLSLFKLKLFQERKELKSITNHYEICCENGKRIEALMIYSLRTISVLKIFQLWYLSPSLKRRGGEKRGTNSSTGSAFRSRNPDLSNLLASRESSLVLYARYISTTYNACPPHSLAS